MRERDDETAEPHSLRWVWWAVALALLLVASGAGVVRGFSPTKVDHAEAVKRAAIGGLLGLVVAGIAIAGWAWYRRRRGIAAGAIGGALAAGLIALLIAAAASIGASTAPPSTSAPRQPRTTTTDDGTGQRVKPNGGVLDQRNGKIYIDTDGDGIVDTELVRCPPPTPTTLVPGQTTTVPPSTTLPPYRVGDRVRVIIDNDCDGTIDAIIYVDVKAQVVLGGGGTPATILPTTTKPTKSESSSSKSNTDLGTLFLVLLAIAAAAGVIIGLMKWLSVRGQRATAAPLPPPEPEPPVEEDQIDEAAVADSFANSGRLLTDDADPRRAIIAAYGALLQGLEAAGAPRLPFEAPEEHLQRSLQQLRVPPESLAAVTRLFLVARFSANPLGEADRQQARAALADAEQHLRGIISSRTETQQ